MANSLDAGIDSNVLLGWHIARLFLLGLDTNRDVTVNVNFAYLILPAQYSPKAYGMPSCINYRLFHMGR